MAQKTKPDEKSSYFISLNNINSRADVILLENLVQAKPGVIYFMAERFPVWCFMLKTKKPITQKDFESWIPATKYKVQSFGLGIAAKEKAYLIFKTNNKYITGKRP